MKRSIHSRTIDAARCEAYLGSFLFDRLQAKLGRLPRYSLARLLAFAGTLSRISRDELAILLPWQVAKTFALEHGIAGPRGDQPDNGAAEVCFPFPAGLLLEVLAEVAIPQADVATDGPELEELLQAEYNAQRSEVAL